MSEGGSLRQPFSYFLLDKENLCGGQTGSGIALILLCRTLEHCLTHQHLSVMKNKISKSNYLGSLMAQHR